MSYYFEVKRLISKAEVLALVQTDSELEVTDQDQDFLCIRWSNGSASCLFVYAEGIIEATSPSTLAYQKLESIAQQLGAVVVGEEEPTSTPVASTTPGVLAGRSTWLGWPFLVIVLSALLVWRW